MQATASSAVNWCLKKGGHVDADDMVCKIANLGTEGRHKANIERDFHTLLRSFSRRLGAKLSTVRARTMFHHQNCLRANTQCFEELLIHDISGGYC